MIVDDPVASGLVQSLASPGGNITGVSTMYSESIQKYFDLLREVVSPFTRAAVLSLEQDQTVLTAGLVIDKLNAAAKVARITLRAWEVPRPQELERAFSDMKHQAIDAVIAWPGQLLFVHRARIAELAVKYRLPTLTSVEAPTRSGLLMSYSRIMPRCFFGVASSPTRSCRSKAVQPSN
jgi:putative ABC transport system substrate-binding protein